MKEKRKHIFRQVNETIKHFGWFTLALIPIFFFINWSFLTTVNAQREAIESKLLSSATQELNNIDLYITTHLTSVHDDIHVIRDSNEAALYLNDQSPDNFSEFRSLVYRIANNKTSFINSTLVDIEGNQLFKISRVNDDLLIDDGSGLVNISNKAFFSEIINFEEPILYIDALQIQDGIPILTLAAPLFHDGELVNFIVIDYDANSFLSVFEVFSNQSNDNLSLGLLNVDYVWLINNESKSLYQITDANEANNYIDLINNDRFTKSLVVDLNNDENDHYSTSSDSFFTIFAQIDMDSAIDSSQSYALRYSWSIFLINLVAIILFGYMGYIIKSKSDDRILLNANMYLSDKNNDGVMITDQYIKIQYVNKAFEKFYDYNIDELKDKNPREIIGEIGLPVDYDMRDIHKTYEGHIWNNTKCGIGLLKFLRIKNEATSSGKVKHYIGIYSEPHLELDDYSKYIKSKEDIIAHLSKFFVKQSFIIDQTMLMMIKVHPVDVFQLAQYLRMKLDKRYVLSIPKANYLMMYVNLDKEIQEQAIDLIDDLIEQYRHLPETDKTFSHTFAIATSNNDVRDIKSLLESLLIVLELSKHNPQLKHHIYQKDMRSMIQREKDIQEVLGYAFSNDEFYVAYQIQKCLKDDSFIGAEALLRWKNKDLGMIPPNEFIPIIENSFYINQLTVMVIRKVIKDFMPYLDSLPKHFRVSINLTNFDFNNSYIIDQIIEIIEASEMSTSHFSFEITESNYLDNINKTNQIIDYLHEKDITISIDDFGTGYSSINSLKSINVDQVKIDKIFIENYPNNDDGRMFRTIARLIQGLNKEIIVEGTETKEQIDFCKDTKCDIVQGYYVSKPIVITDFIHQFMAKINGGKND